MEAFGKDKEDYRAIGTFLVFTADKKENLMWDIIDLLIKEQGLVIPEIVKDDKANKIQLKNVSFFVEDGLF